VVPAPSAAPAHLSPEECWALLRGADLGRLATTVTGRVDIVPVNYAVDGETLLVRTAPGGKLTRLTLADQVAFEVDEVDREAGEAWSVVVHGTAVELRGEDERLAALRLPLRPLEGSPKVRWVRIRPSRLTGRRFPLAPPSRWTTPPDA
jgi:nitroimidazol reductase NimA-like FMN-containing flavoprotein (pyridoxamine 5'-phosphate oxidase superfamily)